MTSHRPAPNPLRPASHTDFAVRHDDDAQLVAWADAVAAQLAPTVAQHDAQGSFAFDHLDVLRREGALALTIPQALGGRGLSLYQTLLFQRQLGRVSGPTALCLGWHLMAFGYLAQQPSWPAQTLQRLAQDVVQRGDLINILLTERDNGNLLRGAKPATVARRSGSGWVLSGHKAFCSSAPALRQMVVFASIEGEDRQGEFLVPHGPGVRVVETWDTLGMRATCSHEIVFDDVPLPDEALAHRFGPGPDQPSAFAVDSRAWGLQLPALYLGIGEAARDVALGFAAGYHSASLGGVILDAPSVQARLGEIELLLGAARAQLFGLAERWERNPGLQDRLHHEVAITKVVVGRQSQRAVELACEIVGGHANSRRLPLERLLRDVQCSAFNPPQADAVVSAGVKANASANASVNPSAAPSTSPSTATTGQAPALAA